jgi:alpha-tubulin suppressor-like RCC1 family protein
MEQEQYHNLGKAGWMTICHRLNRFEIQCVGRVERSIWSMGDIHPISNETFRITNYDVGRTSICMIGDNSEVTGRLKCGNLLEEDGELYEPLEGSFQQVSVVSESGCAIDVDGHLECWGDDTHGQASPPEGNFESVECAPYHCCALDENQELRCWGDDTFGRATPPEGTFIEFDTFDAHGCALRTDHTIACWGANLSGSTDPPEGRFDRIAVGHAFSCALTDSEELE